MNESMISLPISGVLNADQIVRDGILELAGLTEIKTKAPSGFGVLSTKHVPLEIDEDEANEFLGTCSPKTRKVLGAIVALNGSFSSNELEESLGIGPLRGVWTGLTRRTRSLSGNDSASLFDWTWNEKNESYDGVMAQETVDAFRKTL